MSEFQNAQHPACSIDELSVTSHKSPRDRVFGFTQSSSRGASNDFETALYSRRSIGFTQITNFLYCRIAGVDSLDAFVAFVPSCLRTEGNEANEVKKGRAVHAYGFAVLMVPMSHRNRKR